MTRQEVIHDIQREPLDLLIIGGGIVGSGVARDAAMRGLRIALVDKHDFAFGTSSRSSRLLHGGLRYLAQGHIGLVREASVEKLTIHRIAPHLALPLPFIFPTRKGTEWAKWKLSIGVKMYDLLCGGRNLGKSQTLSASEPLKLLPGLEQSGLTGAVRYFDGLTNDARLVLDTLRSAGTNGAMLLNYVSLENAQREGPAWTCQLLDRAEDRPLQARAKCVVNASGAWANQFSPSRIKLRLTKGVHLVIDRSRLRIDDAVVMAQARRILFAIPWGERIILGTTDTDYSGALETPTCDEPDVEYILRVTNATFPDAKLTAADVISTWAGLRPLIADPTGSPSDISRRHEITMPERGWIDVAGGKLTTYRLMAQQTVDLAVKSIDAKARACETAKVPLLLEHDTRFSGIVPPEVTREAVEHYCRNEWALHVEDVMVRRTSWRYYRPDHLEVSQRVAQWMSEILGWDDSRRHDQMQRYEQLTAVGSSGIQNTLKERMGEAAMSRENNVNSVRS